MPLMGLRTIRNQMRIRRSKTLETASGKKYYRFEVTLPAELLRGLGWDHTTEVAATAHRDGILIRKAK